MFVCFAKNTMFIYYFLGLTDFVKRNVLTLVDEIPRYRNHHYYYYYYYLQDKNENGSTSVFVFRPQIDKQEIRFRTPYFCFVFDFDSK